MSRKQHVPFGVSDATIDEGPEERPTRKAMLEKHKEKYWDLRIKMKYGPAGLPKRKDRKIKIKGE